MKSTRIALLIIIALATGCASTQYRSGADITKATDAELLRQGETYAHLQSTIYAGDAKAQELIAIKAELRRRHPEWNWEAIDQGIILRGMTPSEVVVVRGVPLRKSRHSGNYGSREQWIYYHGKYLRRYIYFTNGQVSGWGSS